MSDFGVSGDEQYENESFENDSEVDIPEISENEGEVDDEVFATNNTKNSALFKYTNNIFKSRSSRLRMKDYMEYDSSTDDDTDVIISKTTAEVNEEHLAIEKIELTHTLRALPEKAKPKNAELQTYPEKYNKSYSYDQNTEPHKSESKVAYKQNNVRENYYYEKAAYSEMEKSKLVFMMDKAHIEANVLKTDAEQNNSDNNIQNYESSKIITTFLDKDALSDIVDDIQIERSEIDMSAPTVETEFHLDSDSETKSVRYEPEVVELKNIKSSCNPKINYVIGSETPTSFNSDHYPLHFDVSKRCVSREPIKPKMSNRRNMSFPNERLREIERHNHILLNKIRSQKSTLGPPKTSSQRKETSKRISSAAINRRKQQRQIDLDNQVLKRKLEAISLRRPHTTT